MGTEPAQKAEVKQRRRYTILVEEVGTTRIRQLVYSDRRLKTILTFLAVGFLIMLTSGVFSLSQWQVLRSKRQLIEENQFLSNELIDLRNQMMAMSTRVDSISVEGDAIRLRVDLPPLGEEVRQAGIGSLLPLEGEIIGDERIENLISSIDQLQRELSIQFQSFDEIESRIIDNEERLQYIPSIIPLNSYRFTDGFGYRRDPFTARQRFHDGADFAAPRGTPVYATADGVVTKAHRESGYGKVVVIDHGYGYKTCYGHLDNFSVRRGQRITRGQQIGVVGNTGRSTGPHLHYEVRVENKPVDPLDYFYEGYYLGSR